MSLSIHVLKRGSLNPYLWMCTGSMSFAAMAMFAHALVPYCDWQITAIARSGVALFITSGAVMAAGVPFIVWRPATIWMRSLAGSASVVGTFSALSRLPASDVLTLTNMFPIWVALLSWPMLGERPTVGVWIAVLTSVAGVVLIQQPHFNQESFALLCALGSSICTAFAMIGLNRLGNLDPRAIVVHFSAVSVLFGIASCFIFDRSVPLAGVLHGPALILLLGVGVTATIGQLFLTKAFGAGSAARVSVVGLTQIVFAMIFEIVLWQRHFEPSTLAGMGLIVVPTAWIMTHRV